MAKTQTLDAAVVAYLAAHGLTAEKFENLMAGVALLIENAPVPLDTEMPEIIVGAKAPRAARTPKAPAAAPAADEPNFGKLIGQPVEAKWPVDGNWYPAVLRSVGSGAKGKRYTVAWAGDENDVSDVAEVRPVAPKPTRRTKAPLAISATPEDRSEPAPKGKAKATDLKVVGGKDAKAAAPKAPPKVAASADPKADRLQMIKLAAEAVKARDAAAAKATGKAKAA